MELAVLLGPPGAGKGTVAAAVALQTAYRHISTGAFIRAEMKKADSRLGAAAKSYMARSEFVPDEIALALVEQILDGHAAQDCLLFDGFPRTAVQGRVFDDMIVQRGDRMMGAFSLEAPDEVLSARLSGRRCCDHCGAVFNLNWNRPADCAICDDCGGPLTQRMDDREENVEKRILLHKQQTLDLITYYDRAGVLTRIDACQPPEVSAATLIAGLKTDA